MKFQAEFCKKLLRWSLTFCAVMLWLAKPAAADDRFSLYGYLSNFSSAHLVFDDDGSYDTTTFGNTIHLRLKGDWYPEERLHFHLETSYFHRYGNQNPFVQMESFGFPAIEQAAEPTEDFNQELLIDHAWGLVNIGKFDLQFGKLPVGWGTGYVFNPTDRLNAAGTLDYVSEETPGAVGFLGSYSLTDTLALSGYLMFTDKSRKREAVAVDSEFKSYPFGLKLSGYAKGFDYSFSMIREVLYVSPELETLYYAGFDGVGMLFDLIGIYGEGTLCLPWTGDTFDFDGYDVEENLDIVLGVEYTFDFDMELKAEYFHQGTGQSDKEAYDVLDLLTLRRPVIAEDYLAAFAEKPFLDFYKVTFGGIVNLNDSSYAAIGEFQYDMRNNFQIMSGITWLGGSDRSEFSGEFLMPTDDEVHDLWEPLVYVKLKLSF